MSRRLLTADDVCAKLHVSPSWVFREMAAGRFPRSFPMGPGIMRRWDEADIDAWIDAHKDTAPAALKLLHR